jgi:hypothetical protein
VDGTWRKEDGTTWIPYDSLSVAIDGTICNVDKVKER